MARKFVAARQLEALLGVALLLAFANIHATAAAEVPALRGFRTLLQGTPSLTPAAAVCDPPGPSMEVCSGVCVSLEKDPQNCGKCGNACPTGYYCVGAKCGVCSEGEQYCEGKCVNFNANDEQNCGACGKVCPHAAEGGMCNNGVCYCAPGKRECHGRCSDVFLDADNCGECGRKCLDRAICNSGVCTCADEETDCGKGCQKLDKDADNCGACGNVCLPGAFCEDGKCKCADGKTYCSNGCVKLADDADNCGECGNACSNGEHCVDSQCQP